MTHIVSESTSGRHAAAVATVGLEVVTDAHRAANPHLTDGARIVIVARNGEHMRVVDSEATWAWRAFPAHRLLAHMLEALDVDRPAGTVPLLPPADVIAALQPPVPTYTAPVDLRADQVDIDWLLLDARTEDEFHPITAVTECEDDHTVDHPNWADCVIIHSRAFADGYAHCTPDWTATVRIPAGDL